MLPPSCRAEDARPPHPRAPLDTAPHRCPAPRRDSRKARHRAPTPWARRAPACSPAAPSARDPHQRRGPEGRERFRGCVRKRGSRPVFSGGEAEPPRAAAAGPAAPPTGHCGEGGTRNSSSRRSDPPPPTGPSEDTHPGTRPSGPAQEPLRSGHLRWSSRGARHVPCPSSLSPSSCPLPAANPSPECPRPPSGRVTEDEQRPGNPEIKGEALASLLPGWA